MQFTHAVCEARAYWNSETNFLNYSHLFVNCTFVYHLFIYIYVFTVYPDTVVVVVEVGCLKCTPCNRKHSFRCGKFLRIPSKSSRKVSCLWIYLFHQLVVFHLTEKKKKNQFTHLQCERNATERRQWNAKISQFLVRGNTEIITLQTYRHGE